MGRGGMAKPIAKVSAGGKTPAAGAHPAPLGSGVGLGRRRWGRCRVEQGELSRVWDPRRRRACQENAISLHKTCSSPAPLPWQWLKSFLPRLSQYCHIAASVEVLTPVEGAFGLV